MMMATVRRATGYDGDGDDEIRCSDNAMRGMNDQVRWKKGDFLTIIVLVLMHEFEG